MARLLNIDTPETKYPNKIVECQGPEATEFLTGKLPEGSTVELRFDRVRVSHSATVPPGRTEGIVRRSCPPARSGRFLR
jgi:endonuclease YncB( thermonuclease family)